jgi:hypothetical protein
MNRTIGRRGGRAGLVAVAAMVLVAATALGSAPKAEAAVICNVDSSAIPANLTRARRYAGETGTGRCTAAWNRIVGRVVAGRYTPPGAVLVAFVARPYGRDRPAATLGNRVEVNYNYVDTNYTDWGVLTHELTHVIQSYPHGQVWVAEGIADWARYDAGQPPPNHGPSPSCAGGHNYVEGYECSAAFFKFLNRRFGGAVLQDVNAYQHNGGADPGGFIVARTGWGNLTTLWNVCIREECKGGAPLDD